VREGDLLFEPTPERLRRAHMTEFMGWLREHDIVDVTTYGDLHAWSVRHLAAFWGALAEWDGIIWRRPATDGQVLIEPNGAEGAHFFPGAELNYADHVLRQPLEALALIAVDEQGNRSQLTYGELAAMAGAAAAGLRRLGVGAGDRVAAVLPNGVEAVATFLAVASLGAIWSSCAPEFGAASMADRFQQIRPRVLLIATSYRYGGRDFPLSAKADELVAALPELEAVVEVPAASAAAGDSAASAAAGDSATGDSAASGSGVPSSGGGASPPRLRWSELVSEPAPLEPVAVPFEHPLWILYSSGTTGLPKAIVHGHGGIVLEHVKAVKLHSDFGPGDRAFWFTTTGWMMWNFLVGGLLTGTTIVCYDGSPVYPDEMALWRMASVEGVTYFGTSAPFIEACRRAGLSPRSELDMSAVHSIGSTGAPLPPEGFGWASTEIGDDVLVGSVSGGSDVCTAFLHACPLLPVHAGELQCAALGCAAEAFTPDGRSVIGEVGELVVTTAMPSMPVGFWADDDGSRLHASYFAYYPGVWRHGDWAQRTARGTFVVYGRSDATLNRGGVRMGTSEFYRIVEAIEGVTESLVIDTSELGRDGELILLVVAGAGVDPAPLEGRIRSTLRERLSPRHVPDRVLFADGIPRTLNGKRVEVPIRRILLGSEPDGAVSRDSLTNPEALDQVLEALRGAALL
jgi:acetoacetyl-CoA synthetase